LNKIGVCSPERGGVLSSTQPRLRQEKNDAEIDIGKSEVIVSDPESEVKK
jgi:hypothetical protein